MTWAIRSFALAAGAAALLSSQAVYAAPARSVAAIDPLVSLSVLGTAQSRAVVCAAGTSAATAGAGLASMAQAPAPGCLLPITGPAPPPVVSEPVAPLAPAPRGPGIGTLPLLLGLAAIVALAALLLLNDDDDDGGLQPISPA